MLLRVQLDVRGSTAVLLHMCFHIVDDRYVFVFAVTGDTEVGRHCTRLSIALSSGHTGTIPESTILREELEVSQPLFAALSGLQEGSRLALLGVSIAAAVADCCGFAAGVLVRQPAGGVAVPGGAGGPCGALTACQQLPGSR